MIKEILIKTALAQDPLVPCSGIDCDKADFYQLIVNVIEFAIKYLAFPLVVLFFLIGGFILLTSGGSPNRIDQGKRAITGAVVGLAIVLASVVVIHTFFEVFVDEKVCKSTLGKGGFWSVECGDVVEGQPTSPSPSPSQSSSPPPSPSPSSAGNGATTPPSPPPQPAEPPRQVPRGGKSLPE